LLRNDLESIGDGQTQDCLKNLNTAVSVLAGVLLLAHLRYEEEELLEKYPLN
jgi:hypothetical protein